MYPAVGEREALASRRGKSSTGTVPDNNKEATHGQRQAIPEMHSVTTREHRGEAMNSRARRTHKPLVASFVAAVTVVSLTTLPGATPRIGAASAATLPTLSTVSRQFQPSASNSATAKSVTVSCPSGQQVIGASGFIGSGAGKVVIDELYPNPSLDSVTVSGKEADPTTASWTVNAYATCADPPSGLEWNEGVSGSSAANDKSATAGCTSTTKVMLGTGMDIVGGQGEVSTYSIKPLVDGAGRPDSVTASAAENDPLPSTTNWELHSFAICADETAVDGALVVTADATPSTLGTAGVTVHCPAGHIATGTGF